MNTKNKFVTILIILTLFLGIALRAAYLAPPSILHHDDAISGLIAKHIFELREFPAFHWYSHYCGTLISYIGAVLFWFFGISAATFKIAAVMLSIAWLVSSYFLARRVLKFPGWIYAFLLVAIPPEHVLRFSLISVGVYPETLVLSTWVFLLLIKVREANYRGNFLYIALGLFLGIGLWISPGMVFMMLTVITVYALEEKAFFFSKRALLGTIGLLTGFMPALLYNITHSGATFLRLGSRVLYVDRAAFSSEGPLGAIFKGIIKRIMNGPVLGLRIWYMSFDLWGFIAVAVFIVAILWSIKNTNLFKRQTDRRIEPLDVCIIYLIYYLLIYSIGVNAECERYIVPLYFVFPFIVGRFLHHIGYRFKALPYFLIGLILIFNLSGDINSIVNDDKPPFREVTEWLITKDIHYGYSGYEIAYAIVFESKEKILISPTLFYESFDERTPKNTEKVRGSDKVAYILRLGMHDAQIKGMEDQLKGFGVSYKRIIIGPFVIFYDFSRKIYPEEFDLHPPRPNPSVPT